MQMPKLDIQIILLAFAVVTGLAVLLQTIFLLAILVTVRKASRAMTSEVEKLRSSLMPVIYDTRDILVGTRDLLANTQDFLAGARGFLIRVAPKVEAAAGDLADIAHKLRAQSTQIQSSAQQIMEKVQRQSNRVDGMITSVLDTADRAGGFVTNVVTKPVRQISAMLASVKAIVESLRGPLVPQRPNPSAGDDPRA
jgi:methyl-accepting chemotaxis protein